jgi:hypothetical protein
MGRAIQTAEEDLLAAVSTGTSSDPFAVLGRHDATLDGRPAVVIRALQPYASAVELLTDTGVVPMTRRRPEGLFEATVALDGRDAQTFGYRFRIHEGGGATRGSACPRSTSAGRNR